MLRWPINQRGPEAENYCDENSEATQEARLEAKRRELLEGICSLNRKIAKILGPHAVWIKRGGTKMTRYQNLDSRDPK
jgi:hypothetical protein